MVVFDVMALAARSWSRYALPHMNDDIVDAAKKIGVTLQPWQERLLRRLVAGVELNEVTLFLEGNAVPAVGRWYTECCYEHAHLCRSKEELGALLIEDAETMESIGMHEYVWFDSVEEARIVLWNVAHPAPLR